MIIPARWFAEPVDVETYEGSGAYGDVYAAPVTLLGHVTGATRLDRSGGVAIVTEQTLMLPNPAQLADGSGTVDPSAVLTDGSRVTIGTLSGTLAKVVEHRQPGTGALVYVSASLG